MIGPRLFNCLLKVRFFNFDFFIISPRIFFWYSNIFFCCPPNPPPPSYHPLSSTLLMPLLLSPSSSLSSYRPAGESGVFLLRFSDSKPGQIAISYTDSKTQDTSENNEIHGIIVSHCLVDITLDGYTLSLANTERKYDTLKELLTDCKKLKKFYPNTPKATAFHYLDRIQRDPMHR